MVAKMAAREEGAEEKKRGGGGGGNTADAIMGKRDASCMRSVGMIAKRKTTDLTARVLVGR